MRKARMKNLSVFLPLFWLLWPLLAEEAFGEVFERSGFALAALSKGPPAKTTAQIAAKMVQAKSDSPKGSRGLLSSEAKSDSPKGSRGLLSSEAKSDSPKGSRGLLSSEAKSDSPKGSRGLLSSEAKSDSPKGSRGLLSSEAKSDSPKGSRGLLSSGSPAASPQAPRAPARASRRSARNIRSLSPRNQLRYALNIVEKGDYIKGSKELYRLSRLRAFKRKRIQIKYVLGIAFTEMRLYHLASLQFIYVIQKARGEYKYKALEKLAGITEFMGDENFFNYIFSSVRERDFPVIQREKLYFYFGDFYFGKGKYKKARYYFQKVKPGSFLYRRALYRLALSFAEDKQPLKAARVFRDLASIRKGITDTARVAALMGQARSLYQAERFEASIGVYRSIPRDTKYWHDSLMENSWNYLRAGKFRSALSNFQTLHSRFYQDRYQPESLILRGYVYLYICKYYELEKVLDLFRALYLPTLREARQALKWGRLYDSYFRAADPERGGSSALSPVILDQVMKNARFRGYLDYLQKLREEQSRWRSLPEAWKRDRVGRSAAYILKARVSSTRKRAGRLVRRILSDIRSELEKLSTSEEYLRYDMLRGKRERLKKKIARKYTGSLKIDEKLSRDYFVQNGYEYWPFEGESWLDELGNYHYLGRHNCE